MCIRDRTNSSLDGGNWSYHGYATSTMPSGFSQMLTTPDSTQSVGFTYRYGSGTVAYSAMPLDYYFPSGGGQSNPFAAGAQTYLINLLASTVSTTTCASSGYTGTQLQWCVTVSYTHLDVYKRQTPTRAVRWPVR